MFLISFLFLIQSSFATADKSFTTGLYKINTPENWAQLDVDSKQEITLALRTKDQKTSLTLREFENTNKSLKQNVSKWLADYKSYGFSISKSRPVKLNDQTYGYQIKAQHKKSGKLFNQYMSIKNKKLLVITCQSSDDSDDFKNCDESLTSFSWEKIL